MATITFTYTDYTKEDEDFFASPAHSVKIKRSLHGENAEHLPRILEEFHYFLQGMTYNYITAIEAHTEAGNTFSSTDI